MTRSKNIFQAFLFSFLFIWQLPQNLVALGILLFSKEIRKLDYRHHCLVLEARLPKGAGGISLGNFAIVSPDCARNEHTIRHEANGHTVDSKIFGPLYLVVIGLPSVMHLIWFNHHGAGKSYYDFYTERWANRHAGLR
ncbi:MAG: hypothetical protein MJZ91_09585 [Bacteroidales bacterium]|nr:hypothetical protein [Bacteroidales bacterium]